MELRHLRYFLAVAREENVSRAAIRLHVSQPGLSRQIRDLEEELGFLLFERDAKSLRLTPAGRSFMKETELLLQQVDEAVRRARAVAKGQQGELHLGYAPLPTVRLLPPILRAFRKAYPSIRVKLHDVAPGEMLQGLHEGKLHLAFMAKPTKAMLRGLQFEVLGKDPMRFAVGVSHPMAGLKSLPAAKLLKQPLLSYSRSDFPEYQAYLEAAFARLKARPQIQEEFEDGGSLLTALETSTSAAILPESLSSSTGGRFKLIPISPAFPPLVVGVAWSKGSLSTAAQSLLSLARTAPW